MSEQRLTENKAESQHPSVTLFGHELIRNDLLHELLGKDAPEILYWAGKKLARQYPLETNEDIIRFFKEADWGELTIVEQKRREMKFELSGRLVAYRIKESKNSTFQLEAGFLAQQLEMQKKVISEAFEHPQKRSQKVEFTVKWDTKDTIEV